MTSQTTTSLTKISAAIVALALVTGSLFALATQRAHAVTLSELVELFIALEIIEGDKADQARAVVAQQAPTTPTAPSGLECPATPFTGTMSQGASSAQVMALQQFLNSVPGIQVAASGAGSPGMETMFFGPATRSAVVAYQNMYAAEILTPLGLTAGTGFVGAATVSHMNQLCATPPTPPTPPAPPVDPTDPVDPVDPTPGMSDREADLANYRVLATPSNEQLEEGDRDEAVFGFEFEVRDGDVIINRLDVTFEGQSITTCSAGAGVCERDPWRTFRSVSLWHDGEKVAELDADRRTDWSRVTGDVYRMRFANLNLPFFEGDLPEMYVGVTVRDTIDSQKLDQKWRVRVEDRGLRARDGAGLDQFAGSDAAGDFSEFDVEALGSTGDFRIRLDSSNPAASTIKVSDTSVTRDVAVLVFELEARDVDVLIRELPITLETLTADVTNVIDRVRVEIDNTTYDRFKSGDRLSDITGTSGVAVLDLVDRDEEIHLREGERVTGRVLLDLKRTSGSTYTDGERVEAAITVANRAAANLELANGLQLDTTDRIGTAIGNQHTLVSQGIFAEVVSTNQTVRTITIGSADRDIIDFEVVFDVTAFDDTFYVSQSGATAINQTILDDTNNPITPGTGTSSPRTLTSNATVESGTFRLTDGQTRRFTYRTTFTPSLGIVPGAYRLQMDSIEFGDAPGTPTNQTPHAFSPEEEFRTGFASVNQ